MLNALDMPTLVEWVHDCKRLLNVPSSPKPDRFMVMPLQNGGYCLASTNGGRHRWLYEQ